MVDENARKRQAANVSQTTVNVQVQRQAEVPQIQVPKNVPQTAQSVTTESTKPNIQVAVTVTEQPKPTQAPSKPIQEAPKPVQEAPKPVQEVQKPAETKPVAPAKPAPTPAPAKAKPAAVKPKDHYEPDSYWLPYHTTSYKLSIKNCLYLRVIFITAIMIQELTSNLADETS